jgi:putative flippase GtrA
MMSLAQRVPAILGKQGRRFIIIGFVNTAFHAIVAMLAIHVVHATLVTANVAAFTAATAFSYVLNTTWSFGASLSRATLIRFFSVSILGVCLAAIVSMAAESAGVNYMLGIACVPVFVTPVTFALHRAWTYR